MYPVISSSQAIQALVDNEVEESKWLEYKQTICLDSDGDKKEFLKDVSAFANTEGGYLIYGIAEGEGEDKGKPKEIVGIEGSVDEIKQRMEQILETGLAPRLYGHTIQSYTIDDKTVLVIHVPVSWNRPHMVIKGEDYRFYERTNAGVTKMSVDRLRNAFLFFMAIVEKAEKFRKQRIDKILQMPKLRNPSVDAPIGVFAWHFLPFHSFSPGFQIDLAANEGSFTRLRDVRTGTFNFEGYMGEIGGQKFLHAYWQIFRDGKIEYTTAMLTHSFKDIPVLVLSWVDSEISDYWLPGIVLLREALRLSPPYLVSMSILRIRNLRPYLKPEAPRAHVYQPVPVTDRDHLLFPFEIIENWTAVSIGRALRHLLDQIWQSFGIARDIYFETIVQPSIRELPSQSIKG